MIKINLIGDIEEFDFNVKKLAKKILKKTKKILKIKSKHIVSYIFVDLNEIHRINKEYREKDMPTDVISFAYGDDNENDILPYELGDVFICKEKIKEQASLYGHSNLRECAFLITHGIFSKIDYILVHTSSLGKFFKSE